MGLGESRGDVNAPNTVSVALRFTLHQLHLRITGGSVKRERYPHLATNTCRSESRSIRNHEYLSPTEQTGPQASPKTGTTPAMLWYSLFASTYTQTKEIHNLPDLMDTVCGPWEEDNRRLDNQM